jgi:hypothetical protein
LLFPRALVGYDTRGRVLVVRVRPSVIVRLLDAFALDLVLSDRRDEELLPRFGRRSSKGTRSRSGNWPF